MANLSEFKSINLEDLFIRSSRIMIFGRPGSGKSTFALALSQLIAIPVYHLDKYFYLANWQERNYQEFLEIQQKLVNQDKWIIDRNCIKSLEMRYQKADLVLYFNYPRWICYWRVFKRLFNKDPAIDDRNEGCNEAIRFRLLLYMWNFEKRVRDQIKHLTEKYDNIMFIEMKLNHKNIIPNLISKKK